MEHLDVVIVGAGLSGIGAAYHLQTRCPGKRFALLEARERLGGTWDLFRYPGIRSDSDMHTLGFRFRPWREQKAIADGGAILRYLEETAEENGIDRKIRFRHRVVAASWSTEEARWTLDVERGGDGERLHLTCGVLYVCSGYYDYEAGYTPELPGRERFRGRVVHPQRWTDDVEYAGRRVVVIGSGATAITLVPELAREAAHVVMLQRSPTYLVSLPAEDPIANGLRARLPERLAYGLTRWKNVLLGLGFYQLARRAPGPTRRLLLGGVRRHLGRGYDVETHFTPRYDPWDERLCVVPDGDLFDAIRSGRASVVTGRIETITEGGVLLRSGEELAADLIVTATGLRLLFGGGILFTVDGEEVRPGEAMAYRAMMLSDVPNLIFTFGYTNASWTLKADLTSEYACRLLRHMDRHGYRRFVARRDPSVRELPFVDFTSGYFRRALHLLPKRGDRAPWRVDMNYLLDVARLRLSRIEDGVLELS